MLNNVIKKISSRYFFFLVLVLFSLSKLLPILSTTNKLTYLVFFISVIVFIFRIINIIFIKKKITLNLIKIFTIVLFCFAILSYLVDANFSIEGLRNGREYITLATVFINFIVAFSFDENDNEINKTKFINKISLVVLFFSFIYVFPNTIYSIVTHNSRIYGFAVNVTTYSHFVIVAFACSLYLLLNNDSKKIKKLAFINLFLQLIMLVFTQQRNAYIGFFIGVIISIFLMLFCNKTSNLLNFIKKNKKVIISSIILSILIIIIIFKFIPLNNLIYKLKQMNTSGRVESWIIENDIFKENNIFFGYGGSMHLKVNEYIINHPNVYIRDELRSFLNVGWAHNIYLAFLYDFGIIGLVFLLIILISVIVCYIKFIVKNKNNDKFFNIIILMTFCIMPPLFIGFFDENMLINIYNLPNIMFIIFGSFLGDKIVIKKISFNKRV